MTIKNLCLSKNKGTGFHNRKNSSCGIDPIRRITALLLAILCLTSISLSVFADGEDGTGSIVAADGSTVNGAGESAQETDSIIDANALKAKIDTYISEQGIGGTNKVLSIGYCYTATGDTWYYDGDQWCYSASLYKVPCCMLLAEKEYNGEITADTQINSQYASGTVDYMERKSIVNSDNYTGHAIVEYLGGTYNGKCADQTIKFTDLPTDYFPSDFTDYSYYSAKYYTQILRTLYNDSDKYPRVLEYMKQDQSYHYLDQKLDGQYEVAQKYGAFEEKNGNKNYHSAGIVYTPNPVIITVMTKNITGFEKHIGAIAKILVDYTLELDSQLTEFNQNKLIAQQQEAARLAQAEQQRLAQEAAAQQAAATAPAAQPTAVPAENTGSIFLETAETPAPQESVSSSSADSGLLSKFSLPVIAGLAVVIVIFLVVFIIKLRNSKLEEDEFDDEDYEEYLRGDLSELAPRQEKKKGLFGGKSARKDEFDGNGFEEDDLDDYDEKYVDHYSDTKSSGKTAKGRSAGNKAGKEASYGDSVPSKSRFGISRSKRTGYDEESFDRADFDEAYDKAYDEAYDEAYNEAYEEAHEKTYSKSEKAHEKTGNATRQTASGGNLRSASYGSVGADEYADEYKDEYTDEYADEYADEYKGEYTGEYKDEYTGEYTDKYTDEYSEDREDNYADNYEKAYDPSYEEEELTARPAAAGKRQNDADEERNTRYAGVDISRQNRKARSSVYEEETDFLYDLPGDESDSDAYDAYDTYRAFEPDNEYNYESSRQTARSAERYDASSDYFDSDSFDKEKTVREKFAGRSSRFGRSGGNGYTPRH